MFLTMGVVRSFLTSRIRRPIPNAPLVFPIALVVAGELLLFSQPCKEPPFYLETAFLTFTICSAAWATHLRAGLASNWRKIFFILGGATYDLALLALMVVVIALPISLFMPTCQCYTSRAKAAEIVNAASSYREEIDERFLTRKSLQDIGFGLSVEPKGRIRSGLITADGVIVLASEDPPAVVLMTPTVSENSLEWRCLGFPLKYMPLHCR